MDENLVVQDSLKKEGLDRKDKLPSKKRSKDDSKSELSIKKNKDGTSKNSDNKKAKKSRRSSTDKTLKNDELLPTDSNKDNEKNVKDTDQTSNNKETKDKSIKKPKKKLTSDSKDPSISSKKTPRNKEKAEFSQDGVIKLSYENKKTPKTKKYNCVIHKKEDLNFYCTSCNELVCQECISLGPHNTAVHLIYKNEDANAIHKTIIKTNLELLESTKKKLQTILKQKKSLNIDTIHNANTLIEKNTINYFESMKTNLGFAFRKEVSGMLTWIQYWEADINSINSVIEWYNKFVYQGQNFDFANAIQFLLTHYSFVENIEGLILKPTIDPKIAEEMECKRLSLSNEWRDVEKKLQEYKKNSALAKYKSSIVRQLCENPEQKNTKLELIKAPCVQSTETLDKIISKLEYQCKNQMETMLVCYFCGRICSKKICNKECAGNKPVENVDWFKSFHSQKPTVGWFGSRCHYWGKPSYYGNPLKYQQITDGRGYLMITESFEQNIVLFVIYWMMKFIRALIKNQISLNTFIQNFKFTKKPTIMRGTSRFVDVKGVLSGEIYIKSLQQKFFMNQKLDMDTSTIEFLIDFFETLSASEDYELKNENLVNSMVLNDLLTNPDSFSKYFFQYRTEIMQRHKNMIKEDEPLYGFEKKNREIHDIRDYKNQYMFDFKL